MHRVEQRQRGSEYEAEDDPDPHCLDHELAPNAAGGKAVDRGEEGERHRSKRAGKAVDGNGADHVVDPHFFEQFGGEIDHQAAAGADGDGAVQVDQIAARGNRDKTAQNAVHRPLGAQQALVDGCADDHQDSATGGAGHDRVRDDRGKGRGIGRRRRPAVEADPADPKKDRAEDGQRRVVRRENPPLAVRTELADAGADHDGGRERDPGSGAVHDGGSREVQEPEIRQPGRVVGNQQVAPCPVADDWIYNAANQRDEEIGGDPRPFGDRAGNDRGGGSREHELEDEKGVHPGIRLLEREERRTEGADGFAEHQRETDRVEHHRGDDEIDQIFHRDVDGRRRPRRAGLQHQEAGLHQKDQCCCDDCPDVVGGVLREEFCTHLGAPVDMQVCRTIQGGS